MNRLQAELQRLYPAGDDGQTRAMVLELARPASWEALAKVWQGVQSDLELPAPAIAISGVDGIQLWFSLAEPVPAAQAATFLAAVGKRYLGGVAPERLATTATALPPMEKAAGRWSAFVASDLASLFADEPWLDLPPGDDAQAELLSRLQSATRDSWRRALDRLASAPPARVTAAPAANGLDPRSFLLEVMNDRTIELSLRIEAAKALLPYFKA